MAKLGSAAAFASKDSRSPVKNRSFAKSCVWLSTTSFLFGKIMLTDVFGDGGLQRAFDGIPEQVIRACMSAGFEEQCSISESSLGECLQVYPIHLMSIIEAKSNRRIAILHITPSYLLFWFSDNETRGWMDNGIAGRA